MTKSQELKIKWAKSQCEKICKEMHKNGEIKKFTAEESDYGAVFVNFEIGEVEDKDNVLLRLICRESGFFCIGKRGAITYYSYKSGKHTKKTLGRFDGLLDIDMAQNH